MLTIMIINTESPCFMMIQLKNFCLHNGVKVIHIKLKLYFKFCSVPRLEICSSILTHDVGLGQ